MRRTAVNGRRISRKAGDRLIAARVAPPSQLTMYDPPTPKATCVFAPCRRLRHMYMRRSVRFARHVRRDARRTVSIPATVRHVVGGCQKSGVTNAVAVNVRPRHKKRRPSTSQRLCDTKRRRQSPDMFVPETQCIPSAYRPTVRHVVGGCAYATRPGPTQKRRTRGRLQHMRRVSGRPTCWHSEHTSVSDAKETPST